MGKYIGSTGLAYLWGKIKSVFATKTEVSAKADVENVLFPNFDDMTPVKVIEFDKAANTYSKLFTRANTGISTTMSEVQDVVLMRITVTGTDIYSRSDVVIKFQPGLVNPHAYAFHHTYSNSAGTTGIMYLRFNYPKVLNNNIPWMVDFYQYNSTSRHYKIEVFATTENIAWEESLTNTTYNTTDYNTAQITLYASRGLLWLGTLANGVSTATSASYVSGYQNKYIAQTPIRAGEALAAYDITFVNNGFAYKISHKDIPIDADYGICSIGTTYAANATIGYAYYRQIWGFGLSSNADTITRDNFTHGDRIYLRCTMKAGKIYSDGHLAKKMTAGYTWYLIGACHSTANSLSMNTEGSFFITLDDDGLVTHINGIPTSGSILNKKIEKTVITGRNSGSNGEGEVKSVLGLSCVWNQIDEVSANATVDNTAKDGLTYVFDAASNTITVSGTYNYTSGDARLFGRYKTINAIAGHKYLFMSTHPDFSIGRYSNSAKKDYYVGGNYISIKGTTFITVEAPANEATVTYIRSAYDSSLNGKVYDNEVIRFSVYDLTRMFGAGNEPTTVDDFQEMFPLDYYDCNEGNLLSVVATGIKSVDTNNNQVDSASIPVTTLTGKASGSNTSVTIFPDGMNGIGSARDEINFETGKAIKRIGNVDLGTLSYNRDNKNGGKFWTDLYDAKSAASNGSLANILCAKYITDKDGNSNVASYDKIITFNSTTILSIKDSDYTDAATFKTAMDGVILYYELATPIEYTLDSIPDTSYNTVKGGKEMWLPVNGTTPTTAPIESIIKYGIDIVQEVRDLESSKQDALVSGTNIKTINNESLLGSGNISVIDTSSTAQTKNGQITATKFVTDGGTSGNYLRGNGDLGNDYRLKLTRRFPLQVNKPSGAYCMINFGTTFVRELVLIELVSYGNSATYIDRYAFSKVNEPNNSSGWGLGRVQLLSSTRSSAFTVLYGYTDDDATNPVADNRQLWIAIPHNSYGCLSITECGGYGSSEYSIRNRCVNFLDNITVTLGLSSDYTTWLTSTVKLYNTATMNPLSVRFDAKQDSLVSGTNIKTINNESLLGSGNITIQSGGGDTNVIETVKVNGTALTPDANKAVDITIPTKVSDLNNDSGFTTNTGTVTGVKMNGTTNNPTSGVVDLGTVLTSHQTLKTLNNESLTGSGNISITPGDANVIEAITFNGNAVTVTNKTAAITATIPTVPTNVSSFTNDSGYLTSSSVVSIYTGTTTPSSSLGNNGDIYVKTS